MRAQSAFQYSTASLDYAQRDAVYEVQPRFGPKGIGSKNIGAGGRPFATATRLPALLDTEPAPEELQVLTELLQKSRARFAEQPEQVAKLLGLGEKANKDRGDAKEQLSESSELAAWTVVCRVLLNPDETITKQ